MWLDLSLKGFAGGIFQWSFADDFAPPASSVCGKVC
jgi:hypothetical protein